MKILSVFTGNDGTLKCSSKWPNNIYSWLKKSSAVILMRWLPIRPSYLCATCFLSISVELRQITERLETFFTSAVIKSATSLLLKHSTEYWPWQQTSWKTSVTSAKKRRRPFLMRLWTPLYSVSACQRTTWLWIPKVELYLKFICC